MIKRLLVGVSFLMLGAFGLQAQSSSTQSGSQSGSQQYDTQQPGDPYGSQQGNQQTGSQSNTQTSSGDQFSKTDQDFINKAFQSNQNEIELSRLAAQKASSSDVKQYAQQLVDDHTKANDQLRQIAQSKGINIPSSSSQGADINRFQNLSGANFDRQYIQNQVQAHKKAITMYRNEANNGQDPDLKSFASTQLSNLQQHETMANDLHSKVASGSARANQPENLPRSSSDSGSTADQAQDRDTSSSTSTSSSSTSSTTTDKTMASNGQSDGQLPRTASSMPLVGLFGFMLLAAALILRSFRSLRSNR